MASGLRPATVARYRAYVLDDLIPALGAIKLDALRSGDLIAFAESQQHAGRGRVTLHRCLRTLSSALSHAVHTGRLAHNPAVPSIVPRPPATPVEPWSAQETAAFLACARRAEPYVIERLDAIAGAVHGGGAAGPEAAAGAISEQVIQRFVNRRDLGSGRSSGGHW
ncbi:hypothetical protein [Streptomyces sp. NPDC058297]|uniref:hypothetical protein n=1 Tax=Streptomyces sp. NPDC058297 TaxID=3346433 RepID=UPI0036ED4729